MNIDVLHIAGPGDNLMSIVSRDSESDIRYKSAKRREWQVGTGWGGATGGLSAFYWYCGGEKMALTADGRLYVNGMDLRAELEKLREDLDALRGQVKPN